MKKYFINFNTQKFTLSSRSLTEDKRKHKLKIAMMKLWEIRVGKQLNNLFLIISDQKCSFKHLEILIGHRNEDMCQCKYFQKLFFLEVSTNIHKKKSYSQWNFKYLNVIEALQIKTLVEKALASSQWRHFHDHDKNENRRSEKNHQTAHCSEYGGGIMFFQLIQGQSRKHWHQ